MPTEERGSVVKLNRRQTLREAMASDESYATTLLTVLVDVFGTEALEWTPETLRLEIRDELQVDLPQRNLDKIMAGVALLATDDFYRNLPRFNTLCNVLADDDFDVTTFEPADPAEMAWAITEAMLLAPPDSLETAFSDEIRSYIGEVTAEFGMTTLPDVLAIAIQRDGMRDPSVEFADDPEIYGAFWKNQESKAAEIREMLQEMLQDLFRQLAALKLAHGDTSDLMKKLRREMMRQK